MNIGFQNLVYDMPRYTKTIADLCFEAGYDTKMKDALLQNGLRQIHINENTRLDHLVNLIIRKLISINPYMENRVSKIIIAHSLPVLAPTAISFLKNCVENTSMKEVPIVALSGQPCAILHTAIQIGYNYVLNENDDKGVLIIGADQVATAKERIFFGSAMGDGVVAGLITKQVSNNIILSSVTESEIFAFDGEDSPGEDIKKFRSTNLLNIRHVIESALKRADMALEQIDYIVPHTCNKILWDNMSKILNYKREKILDIYIGETGHLNSNDSLCHYMRAREEKIIKEGNTVVLINPGFGGTRGCTVIKA